MSRFIHAAALCMGLMSCQAARAQSIGETVVVLRTTPVKVQDSIVYLHHAGIHLKVGAIEGDWLWVSHRKAGWIHRRDVATLDEAVAHFTEQITTVRL